MVADALVRVFDSADLNANISQRGFDFKKYKESENVARVNIAPVRLSEQYTARAALEINIVENARRYDRGIAPIKGRESEGQFEYLDGQIDKFLAAHPEWSDRLQSGGIEEVLNLGLAMVKAGTGTHDERFNPSLITEAFNIDNPPHTKCGVFNYMYKLLCDRVISRFSPDLRDKYILIHTGSSFALDLPRSKSDYSKTITHGFETMISQNMYGTIEYTPIDPYHEESGLKIEEKIDFSEARSLDSMAVVVDLSLMDYWNGYGMNDEGNRMRGIALVDVVQNTDNAIEAGEAALLLSYQWGRIVTDSKNARNNFLYQRTALQQRIDNYRSEVERYRNEGREVDFKKNSHLVSLRNGCYRQYREQESNYQQTRYKLEYVENMKADFSRAMEVTVKGLIGEIIKGDTPDPKAAFIFFDLMDNIGSFEIDVEEELWIKAVDFVRGQRIENSDGWRKMMLPGARREWNSYLRRHYENSWGVRPVETVTLKKDNEQVNENDPRYAYTLFRAEVLKLIKAGGISSWERYLPKAEPAGSYTELLVNLVNQKEDLIPAE